jgi:ankyrin repeat protein
MEDSNAKIAKPEPRNLFADKLQDAKQVIHWANMILEKLEKNVTKQNLESFFLPGCNLISHDPYRLLFVQMCRAFINSPTENPDAWAQLANTVARQLLQAQHFSQDPDQAMQEIQMLREIGLGVNVRGPQGHSFLFYLINQGSMKGVQKMLEWQASVEDVDGEGTKAIDFAEKERKTDIVAYLQIYKAGGKWCCFDK